MASLMEELIDVLNREHAEYESLLKLSEEKTPVIIKGDIEQLQKITDEEQIVVSRISHMDKKRETVLNDIANVINKDVTTLKLKNLISMLASQPKEQEKLTAVYEKLKKTAERVRAVNEQNRVLLKQGLEMVEFDMNIYQAMRQAPETANYNRSASNSGDLMGISAGSFDAKQ